MAYPQAPYYDNVRWGGPTGGRIPKELFPATFVVSQDATNLTNLPGALTWPTAAHQSATGATDVVSFANALNICIFTSTGPDLATLGTPATADDGKILILVNTNSTQTVVTTAANKILNGTGTAGDTLTAPAHAGAVVYLIAAGGFWNIAPAGTGTWVLSEV